MAETKEEETTYRFEEVDATKVKITVLNGAEPFEVALTNTTLGMLEDILNVQDTSDEDPRAIFKFLDEYVEGGGRAIPINRMLSLFQAIAKYTEHAMNTQKN